jgi:septum site-determining protein MinC
MEDLEGNIASSDASAPGGIITARGTGDGLVIRLDGRVDHQHLKDALSDFVNSRKSFLSGNEVALEWVGVKPQEDFVGEVSQILVNDFNVTVKSSRLREAPRAVPRNDDTLASPLDFISESRTGNMARAGSGVSSAGGNRPVSLFDGIEAVTLDDEISRASSSDERSTSADSALWDDPDARIIYATLRSGQRVETEHSLIVCGDINSGAEIVAGGDIVVLGTLRGVAHAGAYDETGGGRFIFALNLAPSQLRIGMVISRGGSDGAQNRKMPEVARVDGTTIVVEPYQAKNILRRKI